MRFRAFSERVCPRILSFERVDNFGTSEHFTGQKKRRTLIIRQIPDSIQNFLSFNNIMEYMNCGLTFGNYGHSNNQELEKVG